MDEETTTSQGFKLAPHEVIRLLNPPYSQRVVYYCMRNAQTDLGVVVCNHPLDPDGYCPNEERHT